VTEGPHIRPAGGGNPGPRRLSHAGTKGFGLGVPPGPQQLHPDAPLVTRGSAARPLEEHSWLRPGRLVAVGVLLFVVVAGFSAGIASDWNFPGYRATWHFLNFYTGVFALVALSVSVMIGLAATDQLVLTPRQRILAQAIHRAAAFTALAMLFIHIVCKLGTARIQFVATFVPFLAAHRSEAVGLGVIAAYLMIVVSVVGIIRGRFATGHRPWVWRAVHALAYLAWPFAIIHGLLSGRSAAGWVQLSYVLCVLLVLLALPTRLVTRARAGRRQ
jgi:predicted ferric reductase